MDWEEGLWGTNPTKKDTNNDGTPDNVEIENLKKIRGGVQQGESLLGNNENLTETDKFARELFSTVATLSQNGEIDEATAEKISSSLAEQIKNYPQRKIYKISDIKIINDSSKNAVQKYRDSLHNLYLQYPTKGNVIDILAKATNEDGSIDGIILDKLDPIIKSKQSYINGMLKVNAPEKLSLTHLDVLNALERVVENLNDMQLVNDDVILALSSISQYQNNVDSLYLALNNLTKLMNEKLNN